MPLYDYRCTACGRLVEVMHSIDGQGPTECESCGGVMRKALSPPAIHFKGSGWAKKDAAASAKKSTSTSGASGSKDDPKRADGTGETSSSGGDTEKATPAASGSASEKTPSAAGPKAD